MGVGEKGTQAMTGAASKRKMKNMKVFIWHGVLTDYTSGMVVIVAPSEQAARDFWKNDLCPYGSYKDELDGKAPDVLDLTSIEGDYVFGGG